MLRLDEAICLRIISKTPLIPRRATKVKSRQKASFVSPGEDSAKLATHIVSRYVILPSWFLVLVSTYWCNHVLIA